MHQYLGLPQIKPTAATCNCKHPQSPDHRSLPALPKSTDSPRPKIICKPLSDASHSAISPTVFLLLLTRLPKRQGESYYPAPTVQNTHIHTQCTDRNCSCHVWADRTSLQLFWKAQYPNSPKTTAPSEKMTVLSSFLSPLFQFPVKVQGGKSRKKPHITSVWMRTWWKMTFIS